MRAIEFRRLFDDRNADRGRFELERNRVVRFVVQLECCFNDEWHPVVRYDTAHNFAHRDILNPSDRGEKTELAIWDYNEALTFALEDLANNWENYRSRYQQWLRQE